MPRLSFLHPVILSSLLEQARAQLKAAGIPNASQEARWLLEHVLQRTCTPFEHTTLPPTAVRRFRYLVTRRAHRFPLQYLLGSVDFAGAHIRLTPAVLIPRPETEELVQHALTWLASHPRTRSVADLGTGSGCIAIALTRAFPTISCWASDISPKALRIARINARLNRVASRIHFALAHWFSAWPDHLSFDLIITNPPYVETHAHLSPELAFEPPTALFAGPEGLDAYRQFLPLVPHRLRPGGLFLGEIAAHHRQPALLLARASGLLTARVLKDSHGHYRFLIWHKPTS
ncbi:MAG: peptide chain release factor N(5)-glutamine methyltransferase [bacterium]|nr:peptide chain release factor N(5)-glutamine methyltransferase [bacterium]